MYNFIYRPEDNTYFEYDYAKQWNRFTQPQRDKARNDAEGQGGSIYRKFASIRLPKGWRIRIVRLKK